MSFRWTFFIGVKAKTSIGPAVVLDVRCLELSRLDVLLPFRGAGGELVKGWRWFTIGCERQTRNTPDASV